MGFGWFVGWLVYILYMNMCRDLTKTTPTTPTRASFN